MADSEYQAHEINDFQDVVCIPDVAGKRLGLRHGAKGPILWYRGVENSAEHRLLPSLYRSVDHRAEIHLCQSFQLHAEMRHERCPARDDLGGWLCLMQHYGLATRLLDWSGALLTATYFAVAHNRHSGDGRDEEDSAVWVLDPAALNFRFCSRSGLYSLSHPAMQPMLKRAFGIEQGEDEDRAVAIVPAQFDIRLMVQQSFFTLHGSGKPLEEMDGAGDYLMKFVVKAAAKRKIRRYLEVFGVDRANLFPDLVNLATSLASSFPPGSLY